MHLKVVQGWFSMLESTLDIAGLPRCRLPNLVPPASLSFLLVRTWRKRHFSATFSRHVLGLSWLLSIDALSKFRPSFPLYVFSVFHVALIAVSLVWAIPFLSGCNYHNLTNQYPTSRIDFTLQQLLIAVSASLWCSLSCALSFRVLLWIIFSFYPACFRPWTTIGKLCKLSPCKPFKL